MKPPTPPYRYEAILAYVAHLRAQVPTDKAELALWNTRARLSEPVLPMPPGARTPEEVRAIKERLKDEHLLETFPDTDDFVEVRYPNCKHCNAPRSVPTCVMTAPGGVEPSKLVCGACCKALQAEGWAFTGIGEPRPLPDPKP